MFALTVEEYQVLTNVVDKAVSALFDLYDAREQLHKKRGPTDLDRLLGDASYRARVEMRFLRDLLDRQQVTAPDGKIYEGRYLPADVLTAPAK